MTALVFVLFFLVGVRICTRANNTDRKREDPWFAFGSCFLGVGVVACICQLRQLLTQTMPTAVRIGNSVCVVLWLGNLFTQKAEERDKSCGQQHFDLSFCMCVRREAKRFA